MAYKFIFSTMQQQLQALLETLSSTEPHYIRCVKPNNLLKPAIFEGKNVLQQLRCGVRMLISEDADVYTLIMRYIITATKTVIFLLHILLFSNK